jgi:hypothetical protein
MYAAERDHARNAPPGPHDHPAADLLPQDPVRRADVVPSLGRDRCRLQSEPVLPNRPRSLVHDLVVRGPAVLQREVEARKLELDPDHVGSEDPERFLEQFLARFVPFEHHDRFGVHARGH